MNRHLLNLIAAAVRIDESEYVNDSDLEHAVLQALTSLEAAVSTAADEVISLEPNPVSVKAIADGTTTEPDA